MRSVESGESGAETESRSKSEHAPEGGNRGAARGRLGGPWRRGGHAVALFVVLGCRSAGGTDPSRSPPAKAEAPPASPASSASTGPSAARRGAAPACVARHWRFPLPYGLLDPWLVPSGRGETRLVVGDARFAGGPPGGSVSVLPATSATPEHCWVETESGSPPPTLPLGRLSAPRSGHPTAESAYVLSASARRQAVWLLSLDSGRVVRRWSRVRPAHAEAVALVPDRDGDGVPEVLLLRDAPSRGAHLAGYSGRTGARLLRIDAPATAAGWGAALAYGGDADGDGEADIAVAGRGSVFVYSGDDGRELARFRHASPDAGSPQPTAGPPLQLDWARDLDGDGRGDLILYVPHSDQLGIYSGLGRWIRAQATVASEAIPRHFAAGPDADGDGLSDLALQGDDVVLVVSGRSGAVVARFEHRGVPRLVLDREGDGLAELLVAGETSVRLIGSSCTSPEPPVTEVSLNLYDCAPLGRPAKYHSL